MPASKIGGSVMVRKGVNWWEVIALPLSGALIVEFIIIIIISILKIFFFLFFFLIIW